MKKLLFLLLVLIPALAIAQCGCVSTTYPPTAIPCPESPSDPFYLPNAVIPNCQQQDPISAKSDSVPMSQYWDGHIDTPRTTKADIGEFFDLQDTLYGNKYVIVDSAILVRHNYDTIPVSFIYNLPNENRVRIMSGYRLDDDCGLCITTGNTIYLDENKNRIPSSWDVWLSHSR